jgi:hypothetical protein
MLWLGGRYAGDGDVEARTRRTRLGAGSREVKVWVDARRSSYRILMERACRDE